MTTEIDVRDIRRGHHFITKDCKYFAVQDAETTYYHGWVMLSAYNENKNIVERELFETDEKYYLVDESEFRDSPEKYIRVRDMTRDYFKEDPSDSLTAIWILFIMNAFNRN